MPLWPACLRWAYANVSTEDSLVKFFKKSTGSWENFTFQRKVYLLTSLSNTSARLEFDDLSSIIDTCNTYKTEKNPIHWQPNNRRSHPESVSSSHKTVVILSNQVESHYSYKNVNVLTYFFQAEFINPLRAIFKTAKLLFLITSRLTILPPSDWFSAETGSWRFRRAVKCCKAVWLIMKFDYSPKAGKFCSKL